MSRMIQVRNHGRTSSALNWILWTLAAALPGCSSDPKTEATCASDQLRCGGSCVAAATDQLNCGACGIACQTGQACVAGACRCQAGRSPCNGGCVNLSSDGAHCGACGLACVAPQVCSNGACSAGCGAAGVTQCGSSCADLSSDVTHCGACNQACGAGQSCVSGNCTCAAGQTLCNGTCTDTLVSPNHCGGCGMACGAGQSCSGGACIGGGTGGAGSGGTPGSGAAPGSGGTQAGGASCGGTTSGGAGGGSGGGTAGSCSRPVGSCSSPQVTVTEVDLGVSIADYGREGDTDPLPLAIASMPSGGSRLAALGTDGQVHIAELDCSDNLVSAFSLPGVDLQDIYADDQGGVVLLTRDATNGGTDNCGGGQLCGGSSSPCRTMWLVRFNSAGTVEWETQVTNLGPNLAGYDNGARFVWWYQHHGRIAFDGASNYAAYFCIGITVDNNACVDIHEGDRMQVVSTSGSPVDHPDAFEVGCSHSWQTRIVWDPRENRFVMVCTTDNDCRIAQPSPYRTVATGDCDGTLFGGDLVLSTNPGYWVAWSQGGQIRLDHFSGDNPSDQTIDNAGDSQHPHLVGYGPNNMLLSWESGPSLTAQIRSAGDGAAVGSPFTIDVNDHDFQAFKAYTDGSVAYPGAGSSGTSVNIARVMPCN